MISVLQPAFVFMIKPVASQDHFNTSKLLFIERLLGNCMKLKSNWLVKQYKNSPHRAKCEGNHTNFMQFSIRPILNTEIHLAKQ